MMRMRGLVLVVAVAAASDQPLLLCSPAGRDGFGSQYFHHMAVWGFCAAHGNCCYVHSKLQRVAHGADISRAEALTGLHSGEACRGLLQSPRRPGSQLPDDGDGASMGCTNGRLIREGPTADWTMKSLIYPKRVDGRAQAKYALWQHLHNSTTRRSLRALYDRSPKVGFPDPPPCGVRIHARRGDHNKGTHSGHKESNATLRCVVDAVVRRHPSAKVCIYSEGSPADFGPALASHPSVIWRLGGDPLHTFHELATAPTLFVAAKSTFSAAASVLNVDGLIYYAPVEAYAKLRDEHYNPLATCFKPACACIAGAERESWRRAEAQCCADPTPVATRGPFGLPNQFAVEDYEFRDLERGRDL